MPAPSAPPPLLPDPNTDPWPGSPGLPAPGANPRPDPKPVPTPGTVVIPLPAPRPNPNPGSQPVPQPAPAPIVIPFPNIPSPTPTPGSPPSVVPGNGVVFTPGQGTAPAPRPKPFPGHAQTPPPRGAREVKMKHSALTALFKGAINAITESADVVDALFSAIHWTARYDGGAKGFMNPADKASFIYSNLHLVNWREFWKNLLYNSVEDAAYGMLGKANAARYSQTGSYGHGFQQIGGSRVFDSERKARNPVLDAVEDFLDAHIGTDAEWTMATATPKTGFRTYGLPQGYRLSDVMQPAVSLRRDRLPTPVKNWKRFSRKRK